jgi:hypothetical protein
MDVQVRHLQQHLAHPVNVRARGSSVCNQLGPDYNLDPDAVIVTKTSVGSAAGVSLKWSSTETGSYSLELKIICGPISTIGTATGTTSAPIIQWSSPAVCDGPVANPSPPPSGGGDGDGLEWGVMTLILLSVSGVLYIGGGTYKNQREHGLEGKEALPHIDFWVQIPGLFADGVYFSRMKIGNAHPKLEFLTPTGPGPSVDGGGSGSGSYSSVDEEAGGGGSKSERSGLIRAGDGTGADPPVLVPGGSKSGGKKIKAVDKASAKAQAAAAAAARAKAKAAAKKPKPKAKPKAAPEKGRKPGSSALE